MSKVKCIGIIAEDLSDFESTKIIIRRITTKQNIAFKQSIAGGCAKLRRKAGDYALNLKSRGCDILILVHDRDRSDLKSLRLELSSILKANPFPKYLICIPTEEIEAWFLSDPSGIKRALNLKKLPKTKGLPENILSQKLRDLVFLCSNKEKRYLNTTHNSIIAAHVSLDVLKTRCPSFKELYDFVVAQQY